MRASKIGMKIVLFVVEQPATAEDNCLNHHFIRIVS